MFTIHNSNVRGPRGERGPKGNQGEPGLIQGEIDRNLIPDANNTYDLGSAEKKWKSLYVSDNTIYLGDTPISASDDKILVNSVPMVSKPELDEATQETANANSLYVNTDVRVHQNNVIPIPNPNGSGGWYYSSLGNNEFCSWFLYTQSPSSEQKATYRDVKNVWVLYTPYDDNLKIPYLEIYSVPETQDNISSWYKSKKKYSSSEQLQTNQQYLLWLGTEEPIVFPGIPKVQLTYDVSGSEGLQDDSEIAFASVFKTDPSTAATDYQFSIQTSGSKLADRKGQIFFVTVDTVETVPDDININTISTNELTTGVVNGDLLPKIDDTYTLGDSSKRWKELHSSEFVSIGDKKITPTASSIAVNGIGIPLEENVYNKSEVDDMIDNLNNQIQTIENLNNRSEFNHEYPGIPETSPAPGKFYTSIDGTYTPGDTYNQVNRVYVSETTPDGVSIDWSAVSNGDTLFIAELNTTNFGVYEIVSGTPGSGFYEFNVSFKSGIGAPVDGERSKVYWAPGGSVNFEDAKDFFVAKTGDTMSGRLKLNQIGIPSDSTSLTIYDSNGIEQVNVDMQGEELTLKDGYKFGTVSNKITQINAIDISANAITSSVVNGLEDAIQADDAVPFHQMEEEFAILQNEIDTIRDDFNQIGSENSGNYKLKINLVNSAPTGQISVQVNESTPGSQAPEQITIINVNYEDRQGKNVGMLESFGMGDVVELSVPGGNARYTITEQVVALSGFNKIKVAFQSSTGGYFFNQSVDCHFTIYNSLKSKFPVPDPEDVMTVPGPNASQRKVGETFSIVSKLKLDNYWAYQEDWTNNIVNVKKEHFWINTVDDTGSDTEGSASGVSRLGLSPYQENGPIINWTEIVNVGDEIILESDNGTGAYEVLSKFVSGGSRSQNFEVITKTSSGSFLVNEFATIKLNRLHSNKTGVSSDGWRSESDNINGMLQLKLPLGDPSLASGDQRSILNVIDSTSNKRAHQVTIYRYPDSNYGHTNDVRYEGSTEYRNAYTWSDPKNKVYLLQLNHEKGMRLFDHKITEVADPENDKDVATKLYVDTVVANINSGPQPLIGTKHLMNKMSSRDNTITPPTNNFSMTKFNGEVYDKFDQYAFGMILGESIGNTAYVNSRDYRHADNTYIEIFKTDGTPVFGVQVENSEVISGRLKLSWDTKSQYNQNNQPVGYGTSYMVKIMNLVDIHL